MGLLTVTRFQAPALFLKAPDYWNVCVHDVIRDRCRDAPDSQAVVSWDGSYTYRELDELSDQVASMLRCIGLRRERFIAICMDKSRWVIVALLAVVKSGAAFTFLDPKHPLKRVQRICKDLACDIILSNRAQSKSLSTVANVICVEQAQSGWHARTHDYLAPTACPSNALYASFTSGSTGRPKGVVVEHRAYCSGARAHIKAFGIDQSSRVLQFASYAFDVSIMETLSTLMAGGCVCIISDEARTEPAMFTEMVNKFNASHAFLTPSFARSVQWRDIESISTLVLGGEAMRSSDVDICTRGGVVHLMNAYGPAECSVNASVQPEVCHAHPNNIGHPTGAIAWVVDPDDPESLAPAGTVGELLLEGPIVGRGYINNVNETRKAFIEPPSWLRSLRKGQCPVYRTGDLVSRNPDGSLSILGRKDRQVKIRGGRMECEEIEDAVLQRLPDATDVVVDKVTTAFDDREKLVAFVVSDNDGRLLLAQEAPNVQSQLRKVVPAYMVPSIFMPIARIPRTSSGKVDRHVLRETIARMSPIKLRMFGFKDRTLTPPASEMEHTLRQIYSDALRVPMECIGMNDSFFALGGDSITAALLVSAARRKGLMMTVQDLLANVNFTLAEQAQVIPSAPGTYVDVCLPFSLLRCDEAARQAILQTASDQCRVGKDEIEDIYPCTALQEGVVTASLMKPGMYCGHVEFDIPKETDLVQLKEAWQSAADANPILRTRIVQSPIGLVQVVLQGQLEWRERSSSSVYAAEHEQQDLVGSLAAPLINFDLLAASPQATKRQLVVTIHHAIWDRWTMTLIHNQVEAAYSGQQLVKQPFSPFVRHLQTLNGMEEFWTTEMNGLDAPVFPIFCSNNRPPSPTSTLHFPIEDLPGLKVGESLPNYIHLAWSLLVAHYTDSSEAVYGVTVHGRNAPIEAVDRIAGPTIATMPMRVIVCKEDTVAASLEQIRIKITNMIPYEQAGVQNIAGYSADTKSACNFQSHINIQVMDVADHGMLFPIIRGSVDTSMAYTLFSSYSLNLVFKLSRNMQHMEIDFTYDQSIVSHNEVQGMAQQFKHILRQFYQQPSTTLSNIRIISPQDLVQLQKWNSSMPHADRRCVHDLVLARSVLQPEAYAISSWDGEMKYHELVSLSSAFAHQLALVSVRRGTCVAILLEKSKWAPVAILGVLRAGAACVLLDPQHPRHRMEDIISDASINVLITSPGLSTITEHLCRTRIEISPEFIQRLGEERGRPFHSRVDPEDPAFILFTSGTTGHPKGIIMAHRTITSSIRSHTSECRVNGDTRALHFSSYAFDMAIYEVFTTLAAGGSLCIPSEFDRKNDLPGSINCLRVNFAFLTPSTAQTLQPADVPCLRTLVLVGEAVTQDHVTPWKGRVLLNGYGPAEATICAVGRIHDNGQKPGRIGHVVGGLGWITVPSDPTQLAAIGAIGELLLEGHFLATGYLNLPQVTAASFIDPPPWRSQIGCESISKVYRSGDLVQYQDDGSIRFIGRKDTQLKLRGQRIDLGEVENSIVRSWPTTSKVATEVIQLALPEKTAVLAAFVEHRGSRNEGNGMPTADGCILPPDPIFQDISAKVAKRLAGLLPAYMVPSFFIPVRQMPHTITGKIDRRILRSCVSPLTAKELQLYRSASGRKRPVTSEPEARLQTIWEEILGISRESIAADESFFYLGGDSVSAMKMVSIARRHGFHFTLTEVMDGSSLSDLARQLSAPSQVSDQRRSTEEVSSQLPQTALNSIPTLPKRLQSEGVVARGVVARYQLTEAQRVLTRHYPWTHFKFWFQGEIDQTRLRDACSRLIVLHSILRTVFVVEGRPLQITMGHMEMDLHIHLVPLGENLASVCKSLCEVEQDVEVCESVVPTRFSLVSDPARHEHVFIMRLSHCQYDGFCIPKVVADLEAIYNGHASALLPTYFENYLSQVDEYHGMDAYGFWRGYLSGSCITPMVPPPSPETGDAPVVVKGLASVYLPPLPCNITLATFVKAALAIVLARATGQLDLVFAHTVGGRASAMPGIDRLVGPCLNYAPYRVKLQPNITVSDVPYESVELNQIAKNCTDWAEEDTEFHIIVQHQKIDTNLALVLGNTRSTSFSSTGRLFPGSKVWICSTPSTTGVDIECMASSSRMTAKLAQKMADDISAVILDLSVWCERPLRCIEGLGLVNGTSIVP
ncbi:hypothetical protein BJX99DRAFT_269148 [Aspergillus californicus]